MDNTVNLTEPILKLSHLEKSFGDNVVLRDINLTVTKGEVISIIGSSGSGKSTMLRCINLLETPTGGDILYHGKSIQSRDLKLTEYRTSVGMVFQQFNLFGNMTVLENCVRPQMVVLKRTRQEATEVAMDYLSKVGMSAFINARPNQISGGQKQRVAIAGVIAMKRECIIFDESTAMLDPMGRREVMDTIERLNREDGVTVILITHYMEEAARADKIIVMNEGQVLTEGTPSEVFSDPEKLWEASLDVPQSTELLYRMRKAGLDVRLDIFDFEECADEIARAMSEKGVVNNG